MEKELEILVEKVKEEIALTTKEAELMNVKSKYVGKNSELSSLLSKLKDMSVEDKKKYGSLLNRTKVELETEITNKLDKINNVSVTFDDTLPIVSELGTLHPVTIVAKEVTDILKRMGFTVVSGPEMESEYYNFEALNIPSTHPARDMQDTYWLSNGKLLRTHTSPIQVRAMQKYGSPIRMCAPGRCFRNEDLDASHENTFFQIEGMVIDKNVSINNLIYVMKELLKNVFNQDVSVRLRPGFFPFVEPGFELDVSCPFCGGKGCPTCKQGGWIELCPCGMIHPQVLRNGGIDPEKYSGCAFGLGLDRMVMLSLGIKDIRDLTSGNIKLFKQFKLDV